jgi:hypothetical protein
LNAWEYVPPVLSVPDVSSLPESEVTVCEAESRFSQVTVEPTLTVIDEGLNEKPCILTLAGVGLAGACVVVGASVV